MSILKVCDRPITNNELVSIAASENPDAQIIYKPHPEVIRGTRQDSSHSSPRDVEHIADVIYEDISLADALDTVDHVYTITRSEEHTSELQSLMRISYAVFCLKKKKKTHKNKIIRISHSKLISADIHIA